MIKPTVPGYSFVIHFKNQAHLAGNDPMVRLAGKRFSIALAEELEARGLHPKHIAIGARAVRDKTSASDGSCSRIEFEVSAAIPNATQSQFIDATLEAKAKCFPQRSSGPNIWIKAELQ
jgi:organic hydroperoxide reductase OsmC/OhrA